MSALPLNVNNISYADIETLLRHFDTDFSAAEAHGFAAGLLCLDERTPKNTWITELFQKNQSLSEAELLQLSVLFIETCRTLVSDSFEFDLFLPPDETLLSQQLEGLSDWCRGFLFGIGYDHSSATWPGESSEILKDIIEFTKLDTHAYSEGDEQAFMEVNEYLRAAVMLLRDELRGNTAKLH